MPGIDGFETCQQLKQNPDTAKIPVIFITALSDVENMAKGFSLGAVDYIGKPFQELELLTRVKTHLQLKQLNQDLEKRVEERTQSLEKALAQLQESQLQLIQQEKMSALGNLVAGVAHEINNPIGFVSGNLAEMRQFVTDLVEHVALYQQHTADAEIKKHAAKIDLSYLLDDIPKMFNSMEKGCDRIRDISSSLRIFSRLDKDEKIDFDLHEGLDSTLLILSPRLKAKGDHPAVAIKKDYADLPEVKCFPGQLNQVFMNILANAIDAMESKNQGKSYEEIEADPNQIEIKTEWLGNQVCIHIRDNGTGMSEDVQRQAFNYLFTTKAIGKGTGLGLAISRQIIVDNHGGQITVDSIPSRSTEFTLTLPIQGG